MPMLAVEIWCIVTFYCFSICTLYTYSQEEDTKQISNAIQEIGLPQIQNYSPDDYSAFDQNWGVTQDSSGRMYFANGYGVLSYDGANWDLTELANKSTAFALISSKQGTIYVGGAGELGKLAIRNQ